MRISEAEIKHYFFCFAKVIHIIKNPYKCWCAMVYGFMYINIKKCLTALNNSVT